MRKICTPCCGPSDCYCFDYNNINPEYLQMAIQASGDMAWLNGVNVPLKQDGYNSDMQLVNGGSTDVSGFHNYFGIFTAIRPSSEYDVQPTGLSSFRLSDCIDCYPFWLANLQCISGQSNLFLYNNLGGKGNSGGGASYVPVTPNSNSDYTLRYQFIKGERPTCGSEYQITFDQTKLVNQFIPQTTVSGLINVDITSDYNPNTSLKHSGFAHNIYFFDQYFNLIDSLEYDIEYTGYFKDETSFSYHAEMNPGQYTEIDPITNGDSADYNLANECVNSIDVEWKYKNLFLRFEELYPDTTRRYTNIYNPSFAGDRSDIYNNWRFSCSGYCNMIADYGPSFPIPGLYDASGVESFQLEDSPTHRNVIFNNSTAFPQGSGYSHRGWDTSSSGFFVPVMINSIGNITINGYFFPLQQPQIGGFLSTDYTLGKNTPDFSNKFYKRFLNYNTNCPLPITGVYCYINSHSLEMEHVGTIYNNGWYGSIPTTFNPVYFSPQYARYNVTTFPGLNYIFRFPEIDLGLVENSCIAPALYGCRLLSSGLLCVGLDSACGRYVKVATAIHSEIRYYNAGTFPGDSYSRTELGAGPLISAFNNRYFHTYNFITESGVINDSSCEPFYLQITFPENHLIPTNWDNYTCDGSGLVLNGTLTFEISG